MANGDGLVNVLENEYATRDLYFAAFLYVSGVNIKKLEQVNPSESIKNPVYFIFEDKKRCEMLENAYWNGSGDIVMVNVKEFTTAVRDLRSRATSITRTLKRAQGLGEVV